MNSSVSQFSHLQNRSNDSDYLLRVVVMIKWVSLYKVLRIYLSHNKYYILLFLFFQHIDKMEKVVWRIKVISICWWERSFFEGKFDNIHTLYQAVLLLKSNPATSTKRHMFKNVHDISILYQKKGNNVNIHQ